MPAVWTPLYSQPASINQGIWQAWYYTVTVCGSSTTASTQVMNGADPWSLAENAARGPWQYWNAAYLNGSTFATTITLPQWQSWNFQAEETAEVRAAREAELAVLRAEHERERQAYQAQRLVVASRAEELLMSLLTDEQARSYIENGWFEVRGSKGGRYRIRNRGQAGNVDLMPEIGNERELSYCCHPPGGLPDADAHVAQMLHLVTDEDGFRRTANVSYRRPALRAVA